MNQRALSPKPKPAPAADRGEIAALRRDAAKRDAEIAALSQSVEAMRGELAGRDDRLEEALYELSATTAVASLSGGQASAKLAYYQMIRAIRAMVQRLLPRDATVIVVSKGHDELLRLYRRRAWHFPQDRAGEYSGFYPSNGQSVIAQLEAARSRGGDYFILPATAFWWLEKYPEFARHLDRRYRLIERNEEACAIYALHEPGPWSTFHEMIADCRSRLGREPTILDWATGRELAAKLPECGVFSPADKGAALPYLDGTIDIVGLRGKSAAALKEARRLASAAVVRFADDEAAPEIVWRAASESSLPTVSIVMPCHDGVALTDACLRSLTETLPGDFRGEIIVVDDASADGTQACLSGWVKRDARVKVIRNAKNLGFLGTAQRGADAATGEILVFLNNDLVLLPGWLPPLLRTLRDFPDAGGVGGKLIFPDGTLQEAGGMLFRDASAVHFGRGDHALAAPLYNFVRAVDYCSAALLATPRALFAKLGGFDRAYAPAYYEDTDYCFAVRATGKRIYFQPESAAIHVEGASCGTDLTKGVKRHQQINHARFAKKWSKLLRKLPVRPEHADTAAWQALALRGAEEVRA